MKLKSILARSVVLVLVPTYSHAIEETTTNPPTPTLSPTSALTVPSSSPTGCVDDSAFSFVLDYDQAEVRQCPWLLKHRNTVRDKRRVSRYCIKPDVKRGCCQSCYRPTSAQENFFGFKFSGTCECSDALSAAVNQELEAAISGDDNSAVGIEIELTCQSNCFVNATTVITSSSTSGEASNRKKRSLLSSSSLNPLDQVLVFGGKLTQTCDDDCQFKSGDELPLLDQDQIYEAIQKKTADIIQVVSETTGKVIDPKIDLESVTRADAFDLLETIHDLLTKDERRLFITAVRKMTSGMSMTSANNKQLHFSMMTEDMSKEEEDPESAAAVAAMQAALQASQAAVKYMQDLTKGVFDSANAAMTEIDKWGTEIEGISQEELANYVKEVAAATVLLNNAETKARNSYKQMLSLITMNIQQLESHLNDDENTLKLAIQNAQTVMSVQLENTVKILMELEKDVQDAQTSFKASAFKSAAFSQTMEDNLNNKDGYVDARAKKLRTEAYVGCLASIVFLPAIPYCYATAIGVVETKISKMKDELRANKKKLSDIKGQFDTLESDCNAFATRAQNDYDTMDNVRQTLDSTHTVVVSFSSVSLWKDIVLPQMKTLKTTLTNAIGQP